EIYYKYRDAEVSIKKELSAEALEIRDLRKTLSKQEWKDLGISWINDQRKGKAILKKMGITEIPEMGEKQMAARRILDAKFKTLFNRLNGMRLNIGKRPMNEVDNYLTFFREDNLLNKLGIKTNLANEKLHVITGRNPQATQTGFRFAKARDKFTKDPIFLDPLYIYQNYSKRGIRHIHISPIVAKIAELRRPIKDPKKGKYGTLKSFNQPADEFLRTWSNRIAGLQESKLGPTADFLVSKISESLAFSILGGNLHTIMVQPAVIRNVFVNSTITDTARGIGKLITGQSKAMEKSKYLSAREMDISFTDALSGIASGNLGEIRQTVGRWALRPMSVIDMFSAQASWETGYSFARHKLKLKGDEAVRYADDFVVKTNASGLIGDVAPIQGEAVGRALTLFQTYVINDWNFLTQDVLGIKELKIPKNTKLTKAQYITKLLKHSTNQERMTKVFKLVLATTLLNMLYEDGFDTSSPYPTPFKEFYKLKGEDKTSGEIALGVGKEFLEPIPILGGMKYGSTVLGPVAEFANDISKVLTNDPFKKDLMELGLTAAGVPGVAQVGKSMRAHKRGEDFWGSLMGSYHSKKKTSRSRQERGRRSRARRSRD
ncbi:MAG: hypothetical protein M0R51_15415, partial [Clostridia bacterium]|nr:hypothetical protein [Clostridia bacterium]